MTNTCNWCEREGRTSLYNGESICKACAPYAWAAVLHPTKYHENRRIARKRAGVHVHMERAEDGFQYVYRGNVLIAVHGVFCTGCDATKGRCGDLTRMYAQEA